MFLVYHLTLPFASSTMDGIDRVGAPDVDVALQGDEWFEPHKPNAHWWEFRSEA